MQSEAVESGEWRVVAVAGCKFGEKPFRHTHARAHRWIVEEEDGWLWNKRLHNVFVLRKQVLFNKLNQRACRF